MSSSSQQPSQPEPVGAAASNIKLLLEAAAEEGASGDGHQQQQQQSPLAALSSEAYVNELLLDVHTLQQMQWRNPGVQLHRTHELLCRELSHVWQQVSSTAAAAPQPADVDVEDIVLNETDPPLQQPSAFVSAASSHLSPQQLGTVEPQRAQVKLAIPQQPGVNFIGRIVGPRGITVKQMEQQHACKILVRGRGSVKSPEREQRLLGRAGWEHLSEELHVLITCVADSRQLAQQRCNQAAKALSKLLTVEGDEQLKQLQLMELAIMNGTYRAHVPRWNDTSEPHASSRRQQPLHRQDNPTNQSASAVMSTPDSETTHLPTVN